MSSFEDTIAGIAGHHKPIPTTIPTPATYQNASDNGFRALWVVFVVMVIASAVLSIIASRVPASRRLFHVLTTLITITAALSYFAMASGHATSYHCDTVKVHHKNRPDTHHDVCRQVFWARYVDWSITTPLLLLDLCLLAGLDGMHTLLAVVADLIMVLGGLFAAYGHEHTVQKWGWYAIACVAYIFVVWHVGVHGTRAVKAKAGRVGKLFYSLSILTLVLWTIYPIVWAVADGSRRATVDTEIIAYAILDILAKPVFGIWLLVAHRKLPETNIDLSGSWWSQGLGADNGGIRIGDDDAA